MRPFPTGVLAFAIVLIGAPSPAQAAWCARYQTGASNCGFTTHAQCLAAISGMGGSCAQDARAPAATAEPSKRRAKAPKEPKKKTASRPRPAPVAAPATPPPAPAAATPAAVAPAAVSPAAVTPAPVVSAPQPRVRDFAGARQLILDGQYEAGIKAMQALGFDNQPEGAAYVGLAHRRLGRIAEAQAWYDRALRTDPGHLLALSFDGMLRAEQGDAVRARANLEKIRQLCGGTTCNEYRALEVMLVGAAR